MPPAWRLVARSFSRCWGLLEIEEVAKHLHVSECRVDEMAIVAVGHKDLAVRCSHQDVPDGVACSDEANALLRKPSVLGFRHDRVGRPQARPDPVLSASGMLRQEGGEGRGHWKPECPGEPGGEIRSHAFVGCVPTEAGAGSIIGGETSCVGARNYILGASASSPWSQSSEENARSGISPAIRMSSNGLGRSLASGAPR